MLRNGGRCSAFDRRCFQAVNATTGDADLPIITGRTSGTTTEVSGGAEPVLAGAWATSTQVVYEITASSLGLIAQLAATSSPATSFVVSSSSPSTIAIRAFVNSSTLM